VSQAATREGTGSAILLKNLTRRYVFGSASAAEAAYSTGRADTGAQYLSKGEAVSVDGRLTRIVSIPNVTADMPFEPRPGWRAVAPWEADRVVTPPGMVASQPALHIVGSTSKSGSTSEPTQEPLPAANSRPSEVLPTVEVLPEEDKRILVMLRAGKSPHRIAVDMTGNGGGREYQSVVSRARALLLAHLPEVV
jgi:hypothetical protein